MCRLDETGKYLSSFVIHQHKVVEEAKIWCIGAKAKYIKSSQFAVGNLSNTAPLEVR